MANTITTQVIINGPRDVVIKVNILGDGSGEETDTIIFDASAYAPIADENKLMKIEYALNGFSAYLEWDATADVPLISLVGDHPYFMPYDFCESSMGVAGIPNNAGAGRTGDILITTSGLGAGDNGHIILYVAKRNPPFIR